MSVPAFIAKEIARLQCLDHTLHIKKSNLHVGQVRSPFMIITDCRISPGILRVVFIAYGSCFRLKAV